MKIDKYRTLTGVLAGMGTFFLIFSGASVLVAGFLVPAIIIGAVLLSSAIQAILEGR